MSDAAGKAVELPHQNHVNAPLLAVRHEPIEPWPPLLDAANSFIDVLARDLPTSALCIFAQLDELHLNGLVARAYPAIDCTLHSQRSFFKYRSMARRTSSESGAPVFSDSFSSLSFCCGFR